MKTMTCAQMGGMCDTALHAESMNEMMGKGMEHLEAAHPEMAETVRNTTKEDPMMVAWMQKFNADWESTPEDA